MVVPVLMTLQQWFSKLVVHMENVLNHENKKSEDSFKLRFHLLIHIIETWNGILSLHSSPNDNYNSSWTERKLSLWNLSTLFSGAHFKASTIITCTEGSCCPRKDLTHRDHCPYSYCANSGLWQKTVSLSKCSVKAKGFLLLPAQALHVSNKV